MLAATRILGPSHNRLLIVSLSEHDGMPPAGVTIPRVADQLLKVGWQIYTGPATARRGWVVPGSDPALRPTSRQG